MDKYEIHNYDIKAGEYNICYGGLTFESAIEMCKGYNMNIEGFYYWAVKIISVV